MFFHRTEISGLFLIEPEVMLDDRGFLAESYHADKFRDAGIKLPFVQFNHSYTLNQGVLRGLHYQCDKPQGKLVKVISGSAYNVGVDLREASPTFGRWAGRKISEENRRMMYLPPGTAHGFCTLSDKVHLLYCMTDFFDPSDQQALLWNDPEVGIEWPVENPSMSDRDANNPTLNEVKKVQI